jgi:fumarate reductase iron-sulfur subunit
VIGNPILPVIKLCANPRTVRTMSEHIDHDCSGLLQREKNLDQTGRRAARSHAAHVQRAPHGGRSARAPRVRDDQAVRKRVTGNGRRRKDESRRYVCFALLSSFILHPSSLRGTPMSVLRVSVWRGAESGEFRSYDVPRLESQTVLDVVTYIQRALDPTLAYRYACRVGMCGSCAMTVNGKARWTCRTHVASVAGHGELELAPAQQSAGDQGPGHRHEPLLRQVGSGQRPVPGQRFTPRRFRTHSPDSPQRQQADASIECIGCGICYSSCDVVSWNPDYLGPAALNRAWTLVNDVRDTGRRRASPQSPATPAAMPATPI